MADEMGYEKFKEGLVDKLSYLLGTFNFINYDIEGCIDDLVKSCLAEGERKGIEKGKRLMTGENITDSICKHYRAEGRQQALKEVEKEVKELKASSFTTGGELELWWKGHNKGRENLFKEVLSTIDQLRNKGE